MIESINIKKCGVSTINSDNHTMKKFTLFLMAFVALAINANAQWRQSLTNQATIIDEISVVNDNVIWVTDMNATSFSISTDGGTSWQTKSFPVVILSGRVQNGSNGNICAVSATTAFVIVSMGVNRGVYKTTDSGDTWARQNSAFNLGTSFPDFVYFWNENEGVAIGDGNSTQDFEIYTTANGGTQWNLVSSSNMPAGNSDATFNVSNAFKVLGSSFYFETSQGQIFKSTDKGLTWTIINTPLTSLSYMSFDFKDANNGLLSDYNPVTNTSSLYSTTNGGLTWNSIATSSTNNYSQLRYLPSQNVYMNTSSGYVRNHGGTGMSYSTDNGLSWTQHPSFQNMILGQIQFTPSGKVIMGGTKYMYSSENFEGVNIYVTNASITGSNSIDVMYNEIPDPASSQETANYTLSFVQNRIKKNLNIQLLTQDATNKSIVHVQLQSSLPPDTIILNVGNVKDNNGINGFSVLNRDVVLYNTSKTIQVNTSGTLSSLLTPDELAGIVNLTVTGTIDARDFKTMRDNMPALATVDLSGSSILAYSGTEGTYSTEMTDYPANTTPRLGFYNKKSLTSVILPNALTALGRSSFNSCNGLISINIPSTVTSIGYAALAYCINLKTISIPSSVASIGYGAFTTTGLTTVTLPTGLNSIGQYAFQRCSALNSVTISSTVSTIGSYAFTFDNVLTSFQVASDNLNFSSLDGVLFDKSQKKLLSYPGGKSSVYRIPDGVAVVDTAAFEGVYALQDVTIPSSVTTLSKEAFYACSYLKTVDIPSSVTSIGGYVFDYCSGLTSIAVHAIAPVDLSASDSVFGYVDKNACILYVPSGAKTAYQAADKWKDFSHIMEIDNNLLMPYTALSNIRTYYIIGLGDGNWNNSKVGLGASLYPMSLVSGNSYNANGDGTFTFTGYFQAARGFKLIRDIGSWSEQWGMTNGLYIHNDLLSSDISVPTNGYYTITLNSITNNLTVMASATTPTIYNTIGLIGDVNNWNADINMMPVESSYNHVWSTTYNFTSDFIVDQGVKFRANGKWDINWGNSYFPYGIATINGANIPYTAGKYVIFLNDIDGCYYFVSELGTGIIGLNQSQSVELYPNPVTEGFYVNAGEESATVSVYNLSGMPLLSRQFTGKSYIDMASLPQGLYVAKITNSNATVEQKLVKK